MEENIAFNPIDICPLGTQAVMLEAQAVAKGARHELILLRWFMPRRARR